MTTAYTASNSVPMGALPTTNGIIQTFVAVTTNPASATYAPDGLAAAPIFGLGAQQLQGDEIVAGGIVTLVSYIGTLLNSGALCWVLLECEGGAQQIADATKSHHAITKAQVEALLASTIPAGTIIDFAGTTAPAGYLACPVTQTNVSRTTYAVLFAAIGTTWGTGDGSTTFGLPWFPADYVSSQANANVGTQTVGQVIAHTHGYAAPSAPGATGDGGRGSFSSEQTASTGGTANLAASVRLLKCVKT
ncbi:phage tail protein [Herbaspirillum sp. NPDC101396]|uniref:phage tail protein n=1 Tax=Herbaspirillum sp. NPDC101396 TaxID=3364005 RepID=UPI00383A41EC